MTKWDLSQLEWEKVLKILNVRQKSLSLIYILFT